MRPCISPSPLCVHLSTSTASRTGHVSADFARLYAIQRMSPVLSEQCAIGATLWSLRSSTAAAAAERMVSFEASKLADTLRSEPCCSSIVVANAS